MDFAISLLMFTFALVVYFSYTNNFQKEEKGELDLMLKDAESISSSLALSGYPAGWNNATVVRIGIADEQRINATKVKNFRQLNYSIAKKNFATVYDYFVFFVDSNGDILNINGVCGAGEPLVNVTYSIKSAYYYSDDDDDFLKDFMKDTFSADVYFGDDGNNVDDIDGLISNLSKYQLLVMEHPALTSSKFNDIDDNLNNYSSSGNWLMIGGELVTAQGKSLAGADFYKKSGQSTSDRNSTVNSTDQYLSVSIGDSIVFRQAYYVENTSDAANFKQIATFNADNRNALSRWSYSNGTVYFFSDFDVSYFSGNFVGLVEDLAKSLVGGTCNPFNVTQSQKKLVKAERYLSYDSKVVKMVVYLWE